MTNEPVFPASQECPSRQHCSLDAFSGLNLCEMTDQIVNEHHIYLRRELPRLNQLLEWAVVESGGRGAELRVLKDTFRQFYSEVMLHLDREEQVLFPLIRQLHLARSHPGLYSGGIDAAVLELRHDHKLTESAIMRFRNLTDNYKMPVGASGAYREFVGALPALEADLNVHTTKEDQYLFPRARDCQVALLGSDEVAQPP